MIRLFIALVMILILLGFSNPGQAVGHAAGGTTGQAAYTGRASPPARPALSPLPPTEDPELLLPDLQTLPVTNLVIQLRGSPKTRLLRLTNSIANTGLGALEMVGVSDPASSRTIITQYIYSTGGEKEAFPTGDFIYHTGHNHWHLEDFARYELWSISFDGDLQGIVGLGDKISYCLRDISRAEPGAAASRPAYFECGSELQGISAGWIDTYEYHLSGQTIDITGLPDGIYALRSIVDPGNLLHEIDETNNAALTFLELKGNGVRIIEPAILRYGLWDGDGRRQW